MRQYEREGYGTWNIPQWIDQMLLEGKCEDMSWRNDAMPFFKLNEVNGPDGTILHLGVNHPDHARRDVDCQEVMHLVFFWQCDPYWCPEYGRTFAGFERDDDALAFYNYLKEQNNDKYIHL
jgi:hypothetical protein